MNSWVSILLLIGQLWAAALVSYLLLLTAAAYAAARQARRTQPAQKQADPPTIAVLIPAHNEERLLPGLLASLRAQTYPRERWQMHVVADNCADRTAELARAGGAQAHERNDQAHPGKGPALDWLFGRVCAPGSGVDAVAIIDADTVVSPNFLTVMAEHLQAGETAIQGYYAVRDPGQSWSSGLRQAALAVLHYLRPLGRMALGGSVGLKGNGMVFSAETMRRMPWSDSITEDIELHMRLLLDGERVTFAPEAQALGEMPETLANAKSQHMRWERGKREAARRYVPQLLRAAAQAAAHGELRRAYRLFDAVLEFWIPPFATLFGLSAALAVAGLALAIWSRAAGALTMLNLILGAYNLGGQTLYLLAGLRLVGAPAEVYRSLLYTPVYLVWKNVQVAQAMLRRGPLAWVRTRRNEG